MNAIGSSWPLAAELQRASVELADATSLVVLSETGPLGQSHTKPGQQNMDWISVPTYSFDQAPLHSVQPAQLYVAALGVWLMFFPRSGRMRRHPHSTWSSSQCCADGSHGLSHLSPQRSPSVLAATSISWTSLSSRSWTDTGTAPVSSVRTARCSWLTGASPGLAASTARRISSSKSELGGGLQLALPALT